MPRQGHVEADAFASLLQGFPPAVLVKACHPETGETVLHALLTPPGALELKHGGRPPYCPREGTGSADPAAVARDEARVIDLLKVGCCDGLKITKCIHLQQQAVIS